MNQTEAESVKNLAKSVVEALKKIGGKKCPKCVGGRTIPDHPEGKVPWKWEPKVGEWYLDGNNNLHLYSKDYWANIKPYIPILHWEEIERVLEGVGYSMGMKEHINIFTGKRTFDVGIDKNIQRIRQWYTNEYTKLLSCIVCEEFRQEAVMRVVIELGKEVR